MAAHQSSPQPQPVLVGVGLGLQGPLRRGGLGVGGLVELFGQFRSELVVDSQKLRGGPQSAAETTLGHVDSLMIEHPSEIEGAVAHHGGIDPEGAGGAIPFRRRRPFAGFGQVELHSHILQGAKEFHHGLPLLVEAGGEVDQGPDLSEAQGGLPRAPTVHISSASTAEVFHPGSPAGIALGQLLEQALPQQHLGTASGIGRRVEALHQSRSQWVAHGQGGHTLEQIRCRRQQQGGGSYTKGDGATRRQQARRPQQLAAAATTGPAIQRIRQSDHGTAAIGAAITGQESVRTCLQHGSDSPRLGCPTTQAERSSERHRTPP